MRYSVAKIISMKSTAPNTEIEAMDFSASSRIIYRTLS
jgi:hypothetical protein